MKKYFYVFIMCLLSSLINALPPQKLVYPGDWVYDALVALSLEQGLVFFTGSSLTISQIELMLARIDEPSLSESGMLLYERINKYLNDTSSLFSFHLS